MEIEKVPKIDWNNNDKDNVGHNQQEWGLASKNNAKDKIRVIVAYTVIWDKKSEY